jgi:hypothetical protein
MFRRFLSKILNRDLYFKTSSHYWDRRYRTGGNSGSGSQKRLAAFKANVLNDFVERHQIDSVIEYGCGDGGQLKLAHYPSYIGVDVSMRAVEICRSLFEGDPSKRFFQLESVPPDAIADLSLSLEVIFHLVEDPVFDAYMRRLFESARRFVILYSSNMEQESPGRHVRHRQFTRWIEDNQPSWHLQDTIKNPYPFDPANPDETSFSDFYIFAPV